MAKLSARGRHVVAAVIKEWKNPSTPHDATDGEHYNVALEWCIKKKRFMSDGHILYWEKWKHFKHDRPFIDNWKDAGKCQMEPSVWLQRMQANGWLEDKSV